MTVSSRRSLIDEVAWQAQSLAENCDDEGTTFPDSLPNSQSRPVPTPLSEGITSLHSDESHMDARGDEARRDGVNRCKSFARQDSGMNWKMEDLSESEMALLKQTLDNPDLYRRKPPPIQAPSSPVMTTERHHWPKTTTSAASREPFVRSMRSKARHKTDSAMVCRADGAKGTCQLYVQLDVAFDSPSNRGTQGVSRAPSREASPRPLLRPVVPSPLHHSPGHSPSQSRMHSPAPSQALRQSPAPSQALELAPLHHKIPDGRRSPRLPRIPNSEMYDPAVCSSSILDQTISLPMTTPVPHPPVTERRHRPLRGCKLTTSNDPSSR